MGWGGWSACCSIGRGVNNSVGHLGELPDVQGNQSLDLTCQPKGAWLSFWGAIQGLLALGFGSGLNSRMFTLAVTDTEDGLQVVQGPGRHTG